MRLQRICLALGSVLICVSMASRNATSQLWPAYILISAGQPDAAVFPNDSTVIKLGCREIAQLWDGVPHRRVPLSTYQAELSGKAVAQLPCTAQTEKYLVPHRSAGFLRLNYESGTPRLHAVDSPSWIEAILGPTSSLTETQFAEIARTAPESNVHFRRSPGYWGMLTENGCRGDGLMGYRTNFIRNNSAPGNMSNVEICQQFGAPLLNDLAAPLDRHCENVLPSIFAFEDSRCNINWDIVERNLPLPFRESNKGSQCARAVRVQNEGPDRARRSEGRWRSDGCSMLSNDDSGRDIRNRFVNACALHDLCYSLPWGFPSPAGIPTNGRENCDDNMLMLGGSMCGNDTLCISMADAMHTAVRLGGEAAYNNAQRHRREHPIPGDICTFP